MKNKVLSAHLALLGANLIYGGNYLIAKGVMPGKIGPSAFVFIRIVAASILFWLIRMYVREPIAKKDVGRLILCGLLGVATNQLFFFHGLNLTSPIDASIIITSIPVMVLVFSAILLKERITITKTLGLVIGGIGALLLVAYGKESGGTGSILGNVFVLINTTSYALYLVIVKPLMSKYKPLTVISWVFLFGFFFMFPFGIGDFLSTDFSRFDTGTYLAVIYVVLGTTFLAYLLNIYALNYVSPAVNGSYVYLQPAVTFILVSAYAYLLNDEQYAQDINLVKAFSCLLVISGVYLISRPNKNPVL
ncbi:MAG: EamA family transporter [Flavobacteriaceae bacterium]|nr:DMT family transporter [Bacteroidia bacterium]MBT8287662.1 DMT family transporter [Bacteroidia bacterium]NNF73981.1 EamA family transporter [Flavobacteriaceae bacterium]NNK72847.1 EamA family transporter [Flavobacteriaceae bacterium]